MPVPGLIFLRHAFNRFQAVSPEIEASLYARLGGTVREERIPNPLSVKAAGEKPWLFHVALTP